MKTKVIPVVVGVLGTIKKGMVENTNNVSGRGKVTDTRMTRTFWGPHESIGR